VLASNGWLLHLVSVRKIRRDSTVEKNSKLIKLKFLCSLFYIAVADIEALENSQTATIVKYK